MRLNHLLTAVLIFIFTSGWAQDTVVVFRNDSIRLKSNASLKVDTSLIIDLKKAGFIGKVFIKPKNAVPSSYLGKMKVPVADSFEINANSNNPIVYPITLPRDKEDDRQISFVLGAIDQKGERIKLVGDSICNIYIKPFEDDSLASEKDFEFWVFTGTNFDPFDGIKAQEFFFRVNTLFRISKNQKWLGQIGVYKNRYFSTDSVTENVYYKRNSPFIINDSGGSSYNYTELRYKRTSKRAVDPVGLQIDILRHINDDDLESKSRFFISAGLDINSRQITQEVIDSDRKVDTLLLPQPQKESAPISSEIPASLSTKIDYQVPNYNFNIGFMWIYNNEIANIKTQVLAGFSSTQNVGLFDFRGTNNFVPVYAKRKFIPYFHFRMFATAVKPGISLGLETFLRGEQLPQFSFTLSKVFDLRNFLDVLTPVSSLKLSK